MSWLGRHCASRNRLLQCFPLSFHVLESANVETALHARKTDTAGTLQRSFVLLCSEAVPFPDEFLSSSMQKMKRKGRRYSSSVGCLQSNHGWKLADVICAFVFAPFRDGCNIQAACRS
ncbi:unnamed protein product [Durusdinium trenchii]|uniref:Uncharacterized protein n=1 Tax=Durusdinium trenchii TaxID=1381693 RepID=A0ABP0SVD1_9DINO